MPPRKLRRHLAVVTDSSACLPPDLQQALGIVTVPLTFQFDGEQLLDGQLAPDEFYRRLDLSRSRASTAAPAPGAFLDAFRLARSAGASQVLCLTLAAEYSGTCAAAVNAAEAAKMALPDLRVEVVDTGGLAMTHGFAVLEAARAAQSGATLEEAAALARDVAGRARMIGVLDTMRFLVKSGRVPWVVGWAASLLHIRPVIAFDGGKPRSIARVRTVARGMEEMVRYLRRKAGPQHQMRVAVMHANARDRAAELAERIRCSLGPAELLVTEFTAVMGVHTGPGFLGIAFYPCDDPPRPCDDPPRPQPAVRRRLLERDARLLEEALGERPEPAGRPVVVVLSGPPGAGKSHLARALAAKRPFAHMDSDRLRRALFKRPAYSQAENLRLFSAYHEVMGRLLSAGISVICDATNLKEAYRRPLYEVAEKHGARLVVVRVETPRAVVEGRLDRRLTGAGPWDESEAGRDIYERMIAEAEPIQREHIIVDGSGDVSASAERILREAGPA